MAHKSTPLKQSVSRNQGKDVSSPIHSSAVELNKENLDALKLQIRVLSEEITALDKSKLDKSQLKSLQEAQNALAAVSSLTSIAPALSSASSLGKAFGSGVPFLGALSNGLAAIGSLVGMGLTLRQAGSKNKASTSNRAIAESTLNLSSAALGLTAIAVTAFAPYLTIAAAFVGVSAEAISQKSTTSTKIAAVAGLGASIAMGASALGLGAATFGLAPVVIGVGLGVLSGLSTAAPAVTRFLKTPFNALREQLKNFDLKGKLNRFFKKVSSIFAKGTPKIEATSPQLESKISSEQIIKLANVIKELERLQSIKEALLKSTPTPSSDSSAAIKTIGASPTTPALDTKTDPKKKAPSPLHTRPEH